MDDLLGFALLLTPLLLILILLPLSIWIAVKLSKKYKHRRLVGIGIFLLVFLAPFGDEIAGRFYLAGLCATKGGYEVFDTIEIPEQYWDEQGKPNFFEKHGDLEDNFYRTHFGKLDITDEKYSIILPIDMSVYIKKEKTTGRKIGQLKSFRFWGGWISRNFSLAGPTAISCELGAKERHKFYTQLFQPKQSGRSRE